MYESTSYDIPLSHILVHKALKVSSKHLIYKNSLFAGGASGTSFGSNEDFHALLSSNPLENGDTPPPTLLDEDANDLLDQLVGFQTSKELHSTTENSSTSMPF